MDLMMQPEFLALVQKRALEPHGIALAPEQVRCLVNSLGDIIVRAAMDGKSVHLGQLGLFRCHVTKAGWRWNPTTQTKFKGPDKKKLVFKASAPTNRLLNRQGAEKANGKS